MSFPPFCTEGGSATSNWSGASGRPIPTGARSTGPDPGAQERRDPSLDGARHRCFGTGRTPGCPALVLRGPSCRWSSRNRQFGANTDPRQHHGGSRGRNTASLLPPPYRTPPVRLGGSPGDQGIRRSPFLRFVAGKSPDGGISAHVDDQPSNRRLRGRHQGFWPVTKCSPIGIAVVTDPRVSSAGKRPGPS